MRIFFLTLILLQYAPFPGWAQYDFPKIRPDILRIESEIISPFHQPGYQKITEYFDTTGRPVMVDYLLKPKKSDRLEYRQMKKISYPDDNTAIETHYVRLARIFGMRLTKTITKKKLKEGEFRLTGIHMKKSRLAIRRGIPNLHNEEIIPRISYGKGAFDMALDTSAWQVKSHYEWERGFRCIVLEKHMPGDSSRWGQFIYDWSNFHNTYVLREISLFSPYEAIPFHVQKKTYLSPDYFHLSDLQLIKWQILDPAGEQVGVIQHNFALKVALIPFEHNEKGDWTVRTIANEKTTRNIYYKE